MRKLCIDFLFCHSSQVCQRLCLIWNKYPLHMYPVEPMPWWPDRAWRRDIQSCSWKGVLCKLICEERAWSGIWYQDTRSLYPRDPVQEWEGLSWSLGFPQGLSLGVSGSYPLDLSPENGSLWMNHRHFSWTLRPWWEWLPQVGYVFLAWCCAFFGLCPLLRAVGISFERGL